MTLKDIAKLAGVSQASVSLVRKGRQGVSDQVRERIQDLLRENGFSYIEYNKETGLPMTDGRGSAPPTRCIRLLTYKKHAMLVDGNDGFVTSIIDALDHEARLQGYQMLVSVLGQGNYASVIQSAISMPTDGVLVIATEMTQEELTIFNDINIPLVILDSDFICSPYSCVTMNNRELAFAAVQHLLSLGHTSIGYLHSSVSTGNFRGRAQGYGEALSTIGRAYDERLVYSLRPTLNAAYLDMLAQLRGGRELPSAFFADNDILAIGAMKALTEAGYRIPHDISVIGVDNIPFGAVSNPPLTTMGISCKEIGRWAVQLLLQTLASPDIPKTKIQVSASLIRRNSTAAHREQNKCHLDDCPSRLASASAFDKIASTSLPSISIPSADT